jgi:hypothetical protein
MSENAVIPHVLHFAPDGTGAGLYTELVDLREIGRLDVCRATTVEFDDPSQLWEVHDFTGHRLFRHPSRQTCLDWERRHFNEEPNPTPAS